MIKMNEENIIFQYQVKKRTKFGTRYYYFYATTDIENYLNNKDIKYVRYAKDTALNKQQKRIRELFKENKQLQNNWNELKKGLQSLFEFDEDVVSKDYLECAEDTLEKMQELQGDDKN